MRNYIAVLSLQVRGTIYKTAGILVLLAVAEFLFMAVFLNRQAKEDERYFASLQSAGEWEILSETEKEQAYYYRDLMFHNLEEAVEESHAELLFRLGMIAEAVILSWAACRERSRYFMKRLSVKCRTIYLIWAVYHILCLILLAAWQLLLVFGMDRVLCQCSPAWEGLPQRLFLSFYNVGFLHSLLPLADTVRWVSNSFFLLAAGLFTVFIGYATLDKGYAQVRLRLALPAIILAWMLALFARGIDFEGVGYGKMNLAVVLGSLFCIVWCLAFMLREKQDGDC